MREEELYRFCPVCGGNLNNVIFENRQLPVCEICNFKFFLNPKPTVTAVFLKEDKILLTKRAIEPGKGLWDMPGGFVNKEETLEEALKREVKEELNAELIDLKYLTSKVNFGYKFKNLSTQLIVTYFLCEYRGEIKTNSEISEWDFFDFDQMPEVYFECHQQVLTELKNKVLV